MKSNHFILSCIFALTVYGCRDTDAIAETTSLDTPDWTTETHSDSIAPNYDMVFKENEVIRIDLKIDATSWAAMQADLKSNLSSNSSKPGVSVAEFDPIWAPCEVYYNGIEWYKVGVRYKGNSSLSSAYQAGNGKLSFKLDFDQYESTYPAIQNQRFYGFKQLNLKNNYNDASLIREKVGADLFREFGLASSRATFCEVYVDNGTGSKYFGLYTLVEEVDDTVLDSQYADGSGNLYKPDGDAAAFSAGSYDTSELGKKNNETANDYSDVKALYTIINSSTRSTANSEWKTDLEKVFNVDIFLKWLAANTVMQNWDTYGNMTHNYYLYNNPADNKLAWIPWDNNEAFESGKLAGSLSLEMNNIGSGWPLIKYIMYDADYKLQYQTYMKEFITEIFTVDKMTALYTSYYNLLKESAYAEVSGYTYIYNDSYFDAAIATLKTHVSTRNKAVTTYLK